MCDPADVGTLHYPGDLHSFLSDKQTVFQLENQYHVVIQLKDGEREEDPGEAAIRGKSQGSIIKLAFVISKDKLVLTISNFFTNVYKWR